MKELQSMYNQITKILEDLFKKCKKECKIEEYNSKMKEKEAYKLYFDEAYKYTNFYEEGDE